MPRIRKMLAVSGRDGNVYNVICCCLTAMWHPNRQAAANHRCNRAYAKEGFSGQVNSATICLSRAEQFFSWRSRQTLNKVIERNFSLAGHSRKRAAMLLIEHLDDERSGLLNISVLLSYACGKIVSTTASLCVLSFPRPRYPAFGVQSTYVWMYRSLYMNERLFMKGYHRPGYWRCSHGLPRGDIYCLYEHVSTFAPVMNLQIANALLQFGITVLTISKTTKAQWYQSLCVTDLLSSFMSSCLVHVPWPALTMGTFRDIFFVLWYRLLFISF